MKKIWLVTTDHLENGLWFRDEEDFRVAMNYVAIQAARSGLVVVLAFILMSNHVHFVLKGRQEDVLEFINAFKHRYSIYYRKKYGVKEFLRHNGVDVLLVPNEDEAMERAIAYVQMNCVAAGICAHPSQYPWGCGKVFFDASRSTGRPLKSLSKREFKRLMHSESWDIPGAWMIGDDGFVLPESYVDHSTVEACFRTPARMNYFLNSSSKAKKRLGTNEEHLPALRDQIILPVLPELCQSLFGKRSFNELTTTEQVEFIRQIRYRFSANVNQIARICGITYPEAARLMDGI